jgi:hypothetical protein
MLCTSETEIQRAKRIKNNTQRFGLAVNTLLYDFINESQRYQLIKEYLNHQNSVVHYLQSR